jgi:hypothetical protein
MVRRTSAMPMHRHRFTRRPAASSDGVAGGLGGRGSPPSAAPGVSLPSIGAPRSGRVEARRRADGLLAPLDLKPVELGSDSRLWWTSVVSLTASDRVAPRPDDLSKLDAMSTADPGKQGTPRQVGEARGDTVTAYASLFPASAEFYDRRGALAMRVASELDLPEWSVDHDRVLIAEEDGALSLDAESEALFATCTDPAQLESFLEKLPRFLRPGSGISRRRGRRFPRS